MRGFVAIGLDNPKTPVNVVAALRAAGVYGDRLAKQLRKEPKS